MYLERIVTYKLENLELKLNNNYKVTLNKSINDITVFTGKLTRIDGDYSVITINETRISVLFIDTIEEI